MMRRVILGGACWVVVAMTACGGVTREDGTPSDRLQAAGPSKCKSACAVAVMCAGDTQSCDCGCACPAGASNCDCGPCDCPAPTPETPAKCEADCKESIQKILDKQPECDQAMLTLLDCVASAATCTAGNIPCRAEQNALEDCEEARSMDAPPSATVGGTTTDPATMGGGGAVSSAVYCSLSSGSGSPSGPGSSGPSPGAVVCESGWAECTDGRDYSIRCSATEGPDLMCDCMLDNVMQSSFTWPTCPVQASDVDSRCGWQLQ